MNSRKKIRIAIIGLGNCASSLIQGIEYYRKRPNEINGLTLRAIHGWDISDIEVVAAFDIDQRKIGKSLKDAIFSPPNVATIFEPEIPDNGLKVMASPLLDGMPSHMYSLPEEQRFQPAENLDRIGISDVVACLQSVKPDFLICYLPVGASSAVSFYAECALEAGVSFINAVPVFIASNQKWIKRFQKRNLIVVGDDIKSQFGSTILHRVLVNTVERRGITLNNTYQLNAGGNTDFLNMLDNSRVITKRKSKVQSVQSQVQSTTCLVHAGPSDYVPHLKDNKVAYINIKGSGFGNLPIEIDVKLSVEDSTNSAGVMVDVIRAAYIEKLQGAKGCLKKLSAYGFKSPIQQYTDHDLLVWFQDWTKHGTN